jgi:peptidoglycan hydrolase-like protein with peptidoglycan-binding domain
VTNAVGIDYAFSPHPAPSAVRAYGASFACRYVSSNPANDLNGKNLLKAELALLVTAGISVVLVAEEGANRMLAGRSAGIADAQHAEAVVMALGMTGVPVYFACDFDASPASQAAIDGYLDGAASVIGRDRTGIYGGYYPVKRALDNGSATWAWQTYAWSGGQWDHRAQLRQVQNGIAVGGASCDRDEAQAADFGQWPRPLARPVVPVVPRICTVDLPPLAPGANGNVVRAVQALAGPKRGHQAVIDGDYGPETAALVKGVQDAAGLPQTGTVDTDTWKALLLG